MTRIFKKDGTEVRRETKKTVYRPETDLRCVSTTPEQPERPKKPKKPKKPERTEQVEQID